MRFYIETERLILRDILLTDEYKMFQLDSSVEVQRYIGNKPVTTIQQSRDVINNIRQQYELTKVGRLAVLEKKSDRFIGWAGIKLVTDQINGYINFYDLGYRFMKEFWGNGFATESAKACLELGFDLLNTDYIYGMAHIGNNASKSVLEKSGLRYVNSFNLENEQYCWYEIKTESLYL